MQQLSDGGAYYRNTTTSQFTSLTFCPENDVNIAKIGNATSVTQQRLL